MSYLETALERLGSCANFSACPTSVSEESQEGTRTKVTNPPLEVEAPPSAATEPAPDPAGCEGPSLESDHTPVVVRSRPDTLPSYGWTVAGHMVELPRTAAKSAADPLKLVTAPGWPDWYEATEADHAFVRNPLEDPRCPR